MRRCYSTGCLANFKPNSNRQEYCELHGKRRTRARKLLYNLRKIKNKTQKQSQLQSKLEEQLENHREFTPPDHPPEPSRTNKTCMCGRPGLAHFNCGHSECESCLSHFNCPTCVMPIETPKAAKPKLLAVLSTVQVHQTTYYVCHREETDRPSLELAKEIKSTKAYKQFKSEERATRVTNRKRKR